MRAIRFSSKAMALTTFPSDSPKKALPPAQTSPQAAIHVLNGHASSSQQLLDHPIGRDTQLRSFSNDIFRVHNSLVPGASISKYKQQKITSLVLFINRPTQI
jgi:hypothetical protein